MNIVKFRGLTFSACNTPTLKMEAEFSSGKLASLYRNTERHIAVDPVVQLLVSK